MDDKTIQTTLVWHTEGHPDPGKRVIVTFNPTGPFDSEPGPKQVRFAEWLHLESLNYTGWVIDDLPMVYKFVVYAWAEVDPY